MYNFSRRLRTIFHGLLLVTLAVLPAMAQNRIQASDYERSSSYTFNTNRPELAVDADPTNTTAANLQPWLLGGNSGLRVNFGGNRVATGERVILLLKSTSGGLLNTGVLGNLTARTFMSNNPLTPVQTVQLDNSTANVALLPGSTDINQVSFPVTQSFNQVELRLNKLVAANSGVDVVSVYATVSPLPVQLTAFVGKSTTTGVALNWETASERNADYFDVQRAEDLADGFHSLGQIKCAGNSTQQHTYQFVDAALAGLHYYRLRQVDTDGKETFSPVVAVAGGTLATLLAAYPTRATHSLTITGPAGAHLGIFNQQGQQVRVADMAAQTQQLDVHGLPSGTYFLRDAATGQSTRFIKANGE